MANPSAGKFLWYWPEELQDQYADLVDLHLTSHLHGDHTNYGLISRLAMRGTVDPEFEVRQEPVSANRIRGPPEFEARPKTNI